MRLELQVVALDVLRQAIASLEDPIADAALVLPLRRVGDVVLLEAIERSKRLLAYGTGESLFLLGAPGRRHVDLRFLGFTPRTIELVATIQAPVGKGDGLAVAALEALQASLVVLEGQALADVSHVLAEAQARAEQLQAAATASEEARR